MPSHDHHRFTSPRFEPAGDRESFSFPFRMTTELQGAAPSCPGVRSSAETPPSLGPLRASRVAMPIARAATQTLITAAACLCPALCRTQPFVLYFHSQFHGPPPPPPAPPPLLGPPRRAACLWASAQSFLAEGLPQPQPRKTQPRCEPQASPRGAPVRAESPSLRRVAFASSSVIETL